MHVPLMSILIAFLAVFVVSAESCAQRALGPADTRTLESGFSFVRFPIGYVSDNPRLFELKLDASQYRQLKKFDAKQIPKFDEIKQSTIKKDGLNQEEAQDGEFELTSKNRAEMTFTPNPGPCGV